MTRWTPCSLPGCDRKRHRSNLCNRHYEVKLGKIKLCKDCSTPIALRSVRCRNCNGRLRTQQAHGSRWINSQGYVAVFGHHDHPNVRKTGHIYEHTLVMSEMLGRALLPGENVHHKNGVRHDNRPENLELWVSSQPPGQRPEDLVAWAHEILSRYEAVAAS